MPRQITVKRSEVVPISTVQQQEIDAIKQRISTAKEQASAASKSLETSKESKINAYTSLSHAQTNMELAKKMLDSATQTLESSTKNVEISQNQYDLSQKELKDAEKCLAEAEQKLKVSNSTSIGKQPVVDLQRDDSGSNNKKRKVSDLPNSSSSSTATSRIENTKNTTKASSEEMQVDTVVAQSNNIDSRESSAAIGSKTNDLNITSTTQIGGNTTKRVEDEQVPDYILAESCGNVELNGMYNKVAGVFHCGVPVYTKKGNWNGGEVTFAMLREGLGGEEGYRWYITYFTTRDITSTSGFKTSTAKTAIFKTQLSDTMIPPENGWAVIGNKRGGIDPGPICKSMVEVVVAVEGSGTDVNGTYTRVVETHPAMYIKRGQQRDSKTGADYVIHRICSSSSPPFWCISMWKGDITKGTPIVHMYRSPKNANCMVPPKDGWESLYGNDPPPSCQINSKKVSRETKKLSSVTVAKSNNTKRNPYNSGSIAKATAEYWNEIEKQSALQDQESATNAKGGPTD